MIKPFLILLLSGIAVSGFCQSEKSYLKRALEIQHEVWDDSSAAFRVTQAPAGMEKESAIVLANSFDLNDTSKFAFKLGGPAQKLSFQVTERTRIKLNDRVAVENYSKLAYLKNFNASYFSMYDMYRNVGDSYIGIKIIRADGSETIINTNEDVLKKTGKRQDFLNIPGVQVGDILDYYIRTEQILDVGISSATQGPFTFMCERREYPVLNQKITLRYGEFFRPQYLSANGAPGFMMKRENSYDNVLAYTQTDEARLKDTFWISPLRQVPFVKFQLMFAKKGEPILGLFAGEVEPGSLSKVFAKTVLEYYQKQMQHYDDHPLKITRDYFGGDDKMKAASPDTVAKVLFNAWYYNLFISSLKDTVNLLNNTKYGRAHKISGALEMSKMLSSLHIDNEIYLICSRNSVSFKNLMNLSDMDAILKVTIDHTHAYWMAFDDIITLYNEIPARFQDEFALVLKPGLTAVTFEDNYGKGNVPLTAASENTITDSIQVNMDSANQMLLHISQTSRITGSPRHAIQRNLMLLEDIESALAASVSQKNITEMFSSEKKKAGFQSVFDQERIDQKANFINTINVRFGSLPADVLNYEVINPARCREENAFSYRNEFTMNDWVTSENGEYIIKAGRLLGKYQDLSKPDHIRTLNVYLPEARTFTIHTDFRIPDGYQIKNAGDLNASVVNETGSCTSRATVNGKTLEWLVTETFTHNFEPASNWPKLSEILNTIYTLSGKGILLTKIKR